MNHRLDDRAGACSARAPKRLALHRSCRAILHRGVIASLLVLVATVALPSSAHAGSGGPSEVELQLQGVWGGQVRAVFPDGDTVFIGSGRQLIVLSVTDNPKGTVDLAQQGSLDLGSAIRDIEVRDGLAYVITASVPNYFCIVDVSDPANLDAKDILWTSVGTQLGDANLKNVELYGNWAWVQRSSDISLVNIANPEHAVVGGFVTASDSDEFEIVGDRLYALFHSGSGHALHVFDLVSTSSPDLILIGSSPPLSGHVYFGSGIEIQGDYAYVTTRNKIGEEGGLTILDISDPRAIQLVGSLLGGFHQTSDIGVSGGYAFVADESEAAPAAGIQSMGLATIDVSRPQAPKYVSSFHTHSDPLVKVYIDGNRAYVADQGEGLLVLDISIPSAPVQLASWHSPHRLRKMDKVGSYLYVTDEFNGFTILDVSNPIQPTVAGVHQTGPDGTGNWAIEVRNDKAYLAAGYGGLEVADVSDPGHPTLLGSHGLPFYHLASALALNDSGTVAHVSDTSDFTGTY